MASGSSSRRRGQATAICNSNNTGTGEEPGAITMPNNAAAATANWEIEAKEMADHQTTEETLTLLFEKDLRASDVSKRQARLVIPAEQVPLIVSRLQDSVQEALQRDPMIGVTIEFCEQLPPAAAAQQNQQKQFKSWTWLFKQWKSTGSYVLIQGWIDFVLARNLHCGSRVRFLSHDSSQTLYVSVVDAQNAPPSSSTLNNNICNNDADANNSCRSMMMLDSQKPQLNLLLFGVPLPIVPSRKMTMTMTVNKRKLAELDSATNAHASATGSVSAAQALNLKGKWKKKNMQLCICLRLRTGRSDEDPLFCTTCGGLF